MERNGRISAAFRRLFDTRVRHALQMPGGVDADTFVAHVDGIGNAAIVVQFEPRADAADRNEEALVVFRAVRPIIERVRASFIALRAARDDNDARWDWMFWRSPRAACPRRRNPRPGAAQI